MNTKLYDIAIIGGGPAGISAIIEAKTHGVENILLIEKGDNHSQTIRKFYKENKRVDKSYKGMPCETEGVVDFVDGTKESTLDFFDSLLDNNEIDFAFNNEVENIIKSDDIFIITTAIDKYKAHNVIIAIGKMGKPNKPDYKIPISLKSVVNFNLQNCQGNEKILVVGGGNSAAEYAIELSKINTVTLSYRKDRFRRLNDMNEKELIALDKQELLRLRLNTDIVSLENESGRVKVNYSDGSFTVYDRVIYAIGGSTPVDFLTKCGIELNEKGHPIFGDNYETLTKGLYVSGDLAIAGGGSIVVALNHSHKIIQNIINK